MGLDFKTEQPNEHISLIDIIPIKLMTESPVDETYTLGTVTITKGEYGMCEKINQVIEALNKIIPKVNLQ